MTENTVINAIGMLRMAMMNILLIIISLDNHGHSLMLIYNLDNYDKHIKLILFIWCRKGGRLLAKSSDPGFGWFSAAQRRYNSNQFVRADGWEKIIRWRIIMYNITLSYIILSSLIPILGGRMFCTQHGSHCIVTKTLFLGIYL